MGFGVSKTGFCFCLAVACRILVPPWSSGPNPDGFPICSEEPFSKRMAESITPFCRCYFIPFAVFGFSIALFTRQMGPAVFGLTGNSHK